MTVLVSETTLAIEPTRRRHPAHPSDHHLASRSSKAQRPRTAGASPARGDAAPFTRSRRPEGG